MLENRKISRKCARKQKRASYRLSRDINIKCSEIPTQYIAICNAGLVTGLSREKLKDIIDNIISQKYSILMPIGKSYCFIEFSSVVDAQHFYNQVHGIMALQSNNTPLYLTFTESVPDFESVGSFTNLPPGLQVVTNFITEDEENKLLNSINWEEDGTDISELKHRKAKHFGYKFCYDDNKVDLQNSIISIPESYQFLQSRFKKQNCDSYKYDQLTINRYLPGQGIPPHIDTHSIFEDTILSLSLGSDCLMDFKQGEKKISIMLLRRSLLIMSGESRYAWSHGICPRHNDIIKTNDGTTIQQRGVRISFTFRKVRTGNCQCNFLEYCDTKNRASTLLSDDLSAIGLESQYVHKVYEEISSHFSETRHKQWPNVANFLNNIEKGSFLIDVGCGNGKYLTDRPTIFKIGCDRSSNLMEICRKKGLEVILADCLKLPYRDNTADAAISIAVIHHLSTEQRRKEAIGEIMRVLKPGGRALIYVWAKEQKKNSMPSTYIKYKKKCNDNNKTCKQYERIQKSNTVLPIHENRTEFAHDDVFVPWKRKGGGEFLRYYHVFEEDELKKLCSEIKHTLIEKLYYDQGNWCVILQKINY